MSITKERVQELLSYNPDTGEFFWRRSKGRAHANSKAGRICKAGSGHQYVVIGIDSQEHLAHRLAYLYMTGSWPPGRLEFVDQNGLNTAWENIQEVSRGDSVPKLTAEILRELIHYEPGTGEFRWRKRDRKWFDSQRLCNTFNTRFAGRKAGKQKCASGSPSYIYLDIYVLGTHYHAARLAYLYMTGRWPTPTIDHIDGYPLNNRWSNLREATRAQNTWNRKVQETSSTGIKGVNRRVQNGKLGTYRATISHRGRQINLGSYKTAEEASAAYQAAAQRLFGEFTRG